MSKSEMHAPEDLLALHAMGDPLPDVIERHVAVCAHCRAELEHWSVLISTARSTRTDDVPTEPSARVWSAISTELGLGVQSQSDDPEPAEVVILDSPRRWSTSWLVAASVAGIVGGAALTTGAVALVNSESDVVPIAAPAASASLAALPQHQGNGTAEIIETSQGNELVVDVSGLSAGDGFYEVWLIDPKTSQMIGLGALTDASGRFPIPDGLDLSRYTVVDVSLEPLDGDPVHSTDSVVRGELAT